MTNSYNKIKTLTMTAFGLALSVLSLLVFRGPVSIISSFIIPSILVLFSTDQLAGYFLLSASLFLTTMLFFPTQIIFVTFYLLLSYLLKLIFIRPGRGLDIKSFSVIKYIVASSIILFLGIYLTELIFLVPLHKMMLGISGGNPLIYGGIVLVEGLLVSVFNIGILRLFANRMVLY